MGFNSPSSWSKIIYGGRVPLAIAQTSAIKRLMRHSQITAVFSGVTAFALASLSPGLSMAQDGSVSLPAPSAQAEKRVTSDAAAEADNGQALSTSPTEEPRTRSPDAKSERVNSSENAATADAPGSGAPDQPVAPQPASTAENSAASHDVAEEPASDMAPEPANDTATPSKPSPRPPTTSGTLPSHNLRTGLTITPRIGLSVGGWSRFEVECETQGELDCGDEEFPDAVDASAFLLGVDALYHILPSLRVGAAASWLPTTRARVDGQLRTLGSEVALQGAVEGVADVARALALTGRLHVGASVLFPGNYLDELVEQSGEDCDAAAAAGIFCEVSHAVTPALTYGASVGLLWQLLDTRLRLDVTYQMQSVTVLKQQASDASGSVDANLKMHQNRVLLSAGVEL